MLQYNDYLYHAARSKKESQGSRPLLRPIICICNDLYSSALTKLRQHARIIRFNRPADIYVTKRLRHICDFEGLRADSRALTTLVGLARGDMRCCLNTLQVKVVRYAVFPLFFSDLRVVHQVEECRSNRTTRQKRGSRLERGRRFIDISAEQSFRTYPQKTGKRTRTE